MSAKGKGKEEPVSTSSTANSTSSKAATTTTATPARRVPLGTVIHYFADNQTQGYNGTKYQEAYAEVVKKAMDLQQKQALAGTEQDSGEVEIPKVSEEDLQIMIDMTGLPKDDVQALFTKAKSSSLEEACRAYLHPESFDSSSNGTANESNGKDVALDA